MNGEKYEKVTKDLDYFLEQDMGCNQEEAEDIKKMIVGYNVFESLVKRWLKDRFEEMNNNDKKWKTI